MISKYRNNASGFKQVRCQNRQLNILFLILMMEYSYNYKIFTNLKMSISSVLQPFRGASKVVLNQRFIDDKGAAEIAKFLQSHGKVEFLELKSNDITGTGFALIFKALTKNPNIRQIIIEHNKLGEEGEDTWPGYFQQLIEQSPILQRLNLSNNKLNMRSFREIKTAICNSKSLKLLQIKYNQIPSSDIASFVEQLRNSGNKTLLYVDVSGNKVQKDIINDLQSFLKANREKNLVSKDSLMVTGGFYNRNMRDNTLSLTQNTFNRTNAIDDLSKENMLKYLQDLLDQNRKGTAEMKNKLEAELADLQRRQSLDAQQISELDKKCNELIIANRNLKYEFDKTQLEHQQIERDKQFEAKVREERILQANRELNEMQSKYEEIENKMNTDHDMKMKQIARNWEGRLRQVEERIRDVENDTNSVENEIRKSIQKREKLRAEYEEEQNILRNRIEQEENQRYGFKLKVLQLKIKEVEESREKFYTRGQDILYGFDTNERENLKETGDLEEQIRMLKIKQQQLVAENKDYMARNSNIKQQINLREIAIEKLEEEINRINEQIELRKSHNREQIDKIIGDHEYGRARRSQQKQSEIQKLNELEATLRNYQLENAKLEQEYMILEQRLQATLSKAVQDVFTQNHLF